MHNKFLFYILILTFCTSGLVHAQDIEPQGYFVSDSIKIGEETVYSLSISYPREFNIIFPDSLYDFSPFELSKKIEFPTKSDSILSFDSAVYYLSTFEIDKIQRLSLPIFKIVDGDSIKYVAHEDSLILQELITQLPDSVVLKENSAYTEVDMEFNYPYLLIGLGILVVLAVAVLLLFGKAISRKIKLYRLAQGHKKFLARFNKLLSDAGKSRSSYEHLLLEWKKYMEKLEKIPFTSLTTKEITKIQFDQSLSSNLKDIDRNIYGKGEIGDLIPCFNGLKEYTSQRLTTKMNQIKNVE